MDSQERKLAENTGTVCDSERGVQGKDADGGLGESASLQAGMCVISLLPGKKQQQRKWALRREPVCLSWTGPHFLPIEEGSVDRVWASAVQPKIGKDGTKVMQTGISRCETHP